MALNVATLASAIATGVGSTSGVTSQITAWATGIIQEIQTNAIVTNAVGTVNGTAPTSGGALIAGLASGGTISGMSGASMANFVAAADPTNYPSATPQMISLCTGIVQHIQSLGTVEFAVGTINGTCSNTPVSPGALTGQGDGGTVIGLSGATMASTVVATDPVSFPSVTAQLLGKCDAIANHILSNGAASYTLPNVVGTCPAGGGPITAGAATGGKIL